ncbi:MAG: GAF domain-containing protein [Cyanobacteria bacterium P01_G01_bin.4]
MNPFFEGQAVQFLTRDLEGSARAINEEGQTLSLVAVPIAVSGRWWGVLGFDDCTTERVWSDAEIAVLQTAAACIGSAIERDRTRKDREAAARARAQELETHNRVLARRDRILQATATASNVLLNGEDFDASVSEALESLGESLGFDRIAVGQQFGDPTGKTSGFIRFLYEWDAPGISAQLQDYEDMADFHWDEMGLGSWYEASLRGEAFGQLIDELPKPFRGLMESVDVKSTHNVPIFVEGQFWGVFGIDHCSEKRLLTQSELIALKTAANCVGGAIERDLTRKEREAAVQTRAAEVETYNQALAERDRILEATAAAANVMLTEENFDRAVNDALQIIGAGLEVDRVLLGQYLEPSSEWKFCYIQFLYEWASPNTSLQLEHPELSRIGNGGIEEIIDCLRAGEVFGGIVEELPEPFRSGQQELGAQSVYAVPVVVNSRFWGIVALDDCHQKTRRSDAELEALRTLANCIGSAIEREQLRQAELQSRAAREVAERTALIERERAARAAELEAANAVLTTRDRWLETTAAAANQLLSSDDVATSVNVALATIGENLECDRVTVLEYIRNPDASPDDLGLMRLLYEWDAEGIAAQMDAPELHDIPADGIEDWFREILKGQYVGGVVAELDEPFRSGQQKLGVQSTYGVPVFVEETLWGLVAMDHCREARRLSAAELAVFRTAATCVGSAIYQARVQRDRAARERARLLGSVAEVANLLLQSADYTTVLPEVVRLLGEAVRSDRCAVTQDVIHPDSGHLAVKFLHEWCAAGRESTATCVPEFLDEGQHLRLDGSFLEFHQSLLRGEVVNFLVADLSAPEREFMEAQGNTSMLIVPIMVQGQCWGEIGFDNCGEPRLYDEAEISILRVAAESIAAAISRQAQEDSTRESEERYRNLIELSTEGIYRLELDEPIQRSLPVREQVDLFYKRCYGAEANDAFAAMYGYQTAEEMIGWRLTDIHVEASEQNIEFLSEWLASPDCRISNSESEEQDISGNVRYFLNNVIGIVEDNRLVRVWGTQTDVTELKKIQQAREAAEKAVLAEREKAARERAAELAKTNDAIAQSLNNLAANPELDPFLGTIIAEMARQLNAGKVHLFLYDEPTNTLTQCVAVQDGQVYLGAGPKDPEMFRHPIPADITPGWQVIMTSERPLTFDETQPYDEELWWPESLVWHKAQGHKAITCIPMKAGDVPIGYIGFCFYDRTILTDEQLEFMQALVNQAIIAIQLTRLAEEAKQSAILQEQEKAAQERAAQLTRSNQALKRSIDSLAQQPELQAFLQRVVNEAVEQTGAVNGHLFLYDSSAKTYSLHIATENEGNWRSVRDMKLWLRPISVDEAPAFWELMLGKKPFYVQDLQANLKPGPHIWRPSIDWHLQRGHKSFICAPLVMGDRVLGFMGLPFVDECSVTQDDIELAQALTNQATLAVQLTRLADRARSNALTDERARLAREIHDTLAQAFTGVSLQLEAVRGIITAKDGSFPSMQDFTEAQACIRRARDLARAGLSEARRSVRALRSEALETDTLPDALCKALAQTQRDTGLNTHFYLEGNPVPLSDDLELNLLRISQEAITNTLRHAQATRLDLTLHFRSDRIQLRIADDGKGFNPAQLATKSGFGLIGIRERTTRFYGTFDLISPPGIGTTIEVSIPLNDT